MNCDTFDIKRACFKGKMSSIVPGFCNMTVEHQLLTILCPKSAAAVKIVNKFIRIMCLARDKISEGLELEMYPTMPANSFPFDEYFDNFSDCDELELSLDEQNLSQYEND